MDKIPFPLSVAAKSEACSFSGGSKSPVFQRTKKTTCKGDLFCWLGWRDSDPRDDGVKVRCLTAWLQPNMNLDIEKAALYKPLFHGVGSES